MTVYVLVPFNVLGDSHPWGARRRICSLLPGERDVVRGERLPIVPGGAGLKLPGDGEAVARDATVPDAGNLPGGDGHERAIGTERGEGLVEDPRRCGVLPPHGRGGIQNRRGLP